MIFLKGLNKCKTGVEIKADLKVSKVFSMVLSHFYSLDNKPIQFVSGLVILKKSLINQ